MPSVIGQPVPFLLAPQETIPKTVIIAKSAIKIFFFIVDNLVIKGSIKIKDTNLRCQVWSHLFLLFKS